MNDYETMANQSEPAPNGSELFKPRPDDFAAAKAATYAAFEAARRQETATPDASPLVRWAFQEFKRQGT